MFVQKIPVSICIYKLACLQLEPMTIAKQLVLLIRNLVLLIRIPLMRIRIRILLVTWWSGSYLSLWCGSESLLLNEGSNRPIFHSFGLVIWIRIHHYDSEPDPDRIQLTTLMGIRIQPSIWCGSLRIRIQILNTAVWEQNGGLWEEPWMFSMERRGMNFLTFYNFQKRVIF